MSKKLYTYEGHVGTHSNNENLIELHANHYDHSTPPILLRTLPGLNKYINDLGDTDHEERYLKSRYYYDSILYLRAIAVLNGDGKIAKVIVNNDFHDFGNVTIFGPQDFIDSENPEPLSMEEMRRFTNWKSEAES